MGYILCVKFKSLLHIRQSLRTNMHTSLLYSRGKIVCKMSSKNSYSSVHKTVGEKDSDATLLLIFQSVHLMDILQS